MRTYAGRRRDEALRVRPILRGAVVAAVVVAGLSVASGRAGAQTPPYPEPPESVLDLNAVFSLVLTTTGSEVDAETVYNSAQDFENNAIAEVCTDHQISPCTSQAILAWAPADVRAQEWADLDALIAKHAAGTLSCPTGVDTGSGVTADDCNVYYWFQLLDQQQQIAADQDAINEYASWAGLSTATSGADNIYDSPLAYGPGRQGGFCDYMPPGEPNSGFTYTGNQNPVCFGDCPEEALLIGGCDPQYPSINDFQAWGSWDATEKIDNTPGYYSALVETAAATGAALVVGVGSAAVTPIVAATSAAGLSGSALQQSLFPYANRPYYQFQSRPPTPSGRGQYEVETPEEEVADEAPADASSEDVAADATDLAADGATDGAVDATEAISATAEAAGAVAFVVGIAIFAIVTIAMQIYQIYTDAQISHGLEDKLSADNSSPPDIDTAFTGTAGYTAGLGVFAAATNNDAPTACVGPPYSSTGGPGTPTCTETPTIPAASNSDPSFVVTPVNGEATSQRSIYSIDPSGIFDGTRISGTGWFVAQKYSSSNPDNATAPGTAAGDAGATVESLEFQYVDWTGSPWVAQLYTPTGASSPEFATYPLQQSDESACTPPSGPSPCVTSSITFEEPNGFNGTPIDATATIASAASSLPTASVSFPTSIVVGQTVTFTASGSGPAPGDSPITSYSWQMPTQWVNSSIVCGPTSCSTTLTGQSPSYKFTVPGDQFASLTVTDEAGYSSTTNFVVDVSDTSTATLTSSANPSVEGQPVTLTATVAPSNPFNNLLDEGFFPPVTGEVEFFYDLPGGVVPPILLGPPVPLQYVPIGPLSAPDSPDGTASFTLPSDFVAPASYDFSAVYFGSDEYSASGDYPGDTDLSEASATIGLQVNAAATSVAVTSSANPSIYGDPLTFTASVGTNLPGLGTPTGDVQFYADGSPLGSPVAVNSSGVATYTTDAANTLAKTGPTTKWPDGHAVTADYLGSSDEEFLPSSGLLGSAGSGQAVGPAPQPPRVVNQTVKLVEGSCASIDVLTGASDVNDTIVASTTAIVSGPKLPDTIVNDHNGVAVFCSKADGPATTSFTYKVKNSGAVDPVTNPQGIPQTSNTARVTVELSPADWYAYSGGGAKVPTSCPTSASASTRCSLAQALALAASGATVYLTTPGKAGVYSGDFTTSASVTIEPAPKVSDPILDGGAAGSVVTVPAASGDLADVAVTLDGLTIRNGDSGVGGGLFVAGSAVTLKGDTITGNAAGAFGGGAFVASGGKLLISDSSVSGNTAGLQGGGVMNESGRSVVISGSTVSGNTAVQGGGVMNDTDLSVVRSTFDDNVATGFVTGISFGGAIASGGTLAVSASTLSGDSAAYGDEISNSGTATVVRSTLADGGSGWLIDEGIGDPITIAGSIIYGTNDNQCDRELGDAGFNLENDTTANCGFRSTRHDIVGESPDLGALKNNGGPTETMLPGVKSPVLDQINDPTTLKLGGQTLVLCPLLDQRGISSGSAPDGCAIGSVQVANASLPVVTKISPSAGPLAGGTVVTIAGVDLAGATRVTFGGVAAKKFRVNKNGTITATSPAAPASGTVEVTVTTREGVSPWRPAARFRH
jgi:hypothetical protein